MKPRILILGGGFAGLSCYLMLAKHGFPATIIDRSTHFENSPSLHRCIGDPSYEKNIALPLEKLTGGQFMHAEALSISGDSVSTTKGDVEFDILIIATGAKVNTFGNKGLERFAVPFKRLDDVRTINDRRASSIAIIGGGYTGVELASMLSGNVSLIHAKPRLLDTLPIHASHLAKRYLTKQGVRLIMDDRVVDCSERRVHLASGSSLGADLIILTTGITPNLRVDQSDLASDLSIAKNIFIAGDASNSGHLKTAHNAMIEGRLAAASVISSITGSKIKAKTRDWHLLAVALGKRGGFLVSDTAVYNVPGVGFMKKLIELRVMIEFTHRIMIWV